MKKSDIGVLGFIVANISFLFIFYQKGITPILITIIGVVLFVCFIDKDVVPIKKHNK